MKIAIIGTKGIPNNYGGFEQFAEYLSVGLVEKGHEVTVYNPHLHPYQSSTYQGVNIRRIYSPEKAIGAMANFIYDFLSLKDALKLDFDIILECGYHSSAPSFYLMGQRTRPILITNMDGIEWKRSKWNRFTRRIIKETEKIAVKKSRYLVSDNIGIQQYYKEAFNADSYYIAYGAAPVDTFDKSGLLPYGLAEDQYFMLVARLEPENNIELILDGYLQSASGLPFIVIGNHQTKYGTYLKKKYEGKTIRFLGGVYQKEPLDNLRHYARIYFHGHSVGGTNPSLLEAMACQSVIAAHANKFNRSVLGNNAFFFLTEKEVAGIISKIGEAKDIQLKRESNFLVIKNEYTWSRIVDNYERLFQKALTERP